MPKEYHSISNEELFQIQETSAVEGLSNAEAAKRLEENGANELSQKKGDPIWKIFLSQFKDFMVIILIIAAAISAFVAKEYVDAAVILLLVIVNAIIGTVQEVKAENSLKALEKMSASSAKVLRDGAQKTIPGRELVVGDVVLIDAGNAVPADLRLFEYVNLKIDESALTGESLPVDKAEMILPEDAGIGDRLNMAYSSSLVTYGRGKGVVVYTGMGTEVGKIASMIQDAPEQQTPMQKRLDAVGKTLGIAALSVCGIMFVVGILYGRPPLAMFMSAIALAVAAIPEGLPTISTMVLALGVQRMAARNAIVRTLPSVETLGSATVICSDKTGTLTQNKMTVLEYVYPGDSEPRDAKNAEDDQLMKSIVLCTDATINGGKAMGDPTEVALVELGISTGIDKSTLETEYPRISELPFDSGRKRMSTVHQNPNGKLDVYTKGGMDEILAVCKYVCFNGVVEEIKQSHLDNLEELNKSMAMDALRVLAFATKSLDELPESCLVDASGDEAMYAKQCDLEVDLIFIGMVGMIDPPRPEAKLAVAECHSAGIRPVMITGDHKLTAAAIAKELDIMTSDDDRVVTGAELEQMTDDELFDIVEDVAVYARVSPEHKVRIIDAWKKHGDVVAMTGDGVNDAPALKRSDIGCAMGKGGTDVAKDASDLILVDDNFATVVSAVEEGRRIYDNVIKSISFLLSCNIGEIITLFVATLFNWHEPLLAIHLLLVNLVTDGLPALALGVDPAEPDIMHRQAKKNKGIFSKGLIFRVGYQGVMVGVLTLLAYLIGAEFNPKNPADLGQAQSMAFAVLALSQLVHSFNIRSARASLFKVKPWENMKLVGACVLSFVITVACINVPGLNTVLNLEPLSSMHLFEVAVLSLTPFVVVELMKFFKLNTTKEEEEDYAIQKRVAREKTAK